MGPILTVIAGASLVAWLYLVLGRGGFWRAGERLDGPGPEPADWPAVVAVVPARNEADVIEGTTGSLLRQDYPGRLDIILVDDHSSDGTAECARRALANGSPTRQLTVMSSGPLPAGWTGKLWALSQGTSEATSMAPAARYICFTDADIEHDTGSVRRLVAKAETEGADLVSLMVLLSCRGFWERLLIPPFVFFFQKLYPFSWVNDAKRPTAAAAGGCMLVRRTALERAGGLQAIRHAIIDDCALARRIKLGEDGRRHPIWLGLTSSLRSIRPYEGLGGLWSMVARSAFAQLNYSVVLVVGTVLGMGALYLAPPVIALSFPWHGDPAAATLGACAFVLMALAIVPTLRLYRQPVVLAPLLPIAALLYCGMTIDSALRYARGTGGRWKGRVEQGPSRSSLPRHS